MVFESSETLKKVGSREGRQWPRAVYISLTLAGKNLDIFCVYQTQTSIAITFNKKYFKEYNGRRCTNIFLIVHMKYIFQKNTPTK